MAEYHLSTHQRLNSSLFALLVLPLVQVIAALESWGKPIRDAALRAIESNQASNGLQVGCTVLQR
jgi:hypothetical protein